MTIKYFINEIEYLQLSIEQRRKITDEIAKALGLIPADRKQDKRQTIIV